MSAPCYPLDGGMTAMARSPHWLEPLVSEVRGLGRALVVCRTTASQREVLRAFAAASSAPSAMTGVEVVTLRGLVASREPQNLLGGGSATAPELPDQHAWRTNLQGRPGLRRLLRRHLARAHAVVAAGGSVDGLRPELKDLVREGWGRPLGLSGSLVLRASPPKDTCFAVGYAKGGFGFAGAVEPIDSAVLAALSPRFTFDVDPEAASPGPLPASLVPDPSAEARFVAGRARAAAGGRVLVLVSNRETEERIRAALSRNGLAAADDDSIPLSRHSLSAVLAPLLPLFSSLGTEPLEATDFLRLATDPILSRKPPLAGIQTIPELGDATPRASARHVRELVLQCHRVRAPLGEWLAALSTLERAAADRLTSADEDSRPARAGFLASARILLAQLKTLELRTTLGHGRLSDVAHLVSDLGLSSPDDQLGHAIQGALRDEGFRPAAEDDFDEALSGSVGSRRVDDGVQILRYESYDGRISDLLLLADLHDKGIARTPAPDPLLRPEDMAVLGIPSGRQVIAERLAIVRFAAVRTAVAGGAVLGVVSETDPSGRRVSAPVGLELAFEGCDDADCYGLAVNLPERVDRTALEEGRGEHDALSLQLDAEWARRGVAFDGATAAVSTAQGETLADQLERDLPRLPPDLRPFLGESGQHPDGVGGLPDGFTLSASRLRAFTNCLYHAFLESVLRLRAPEEPTEDLDPREVGTAVHAALQDAMLGVKLLVPATELDAHRKAILERLRAATSNVLEKVAAGREAPDAEPLRLARQGLERRWMQHWERFLERRLGPVEKANEKVAATVAKELEADLPGVPALAELIRPALTNRRDMDGAPKLIAQALVACGADPEQFGPVLCQSMSSNKVQNALKGFLARPEVRRAVEALLAMARLRLELPDFHPMGDLEVIATELAFGDLEVDGERGKPMELRLGRVPIPVRGSIDAVLRRRGSASDGGFEIRDFKTGRGGSVKPGDQAERLLLPQTALYGLVAGALERVGKVKGPIRVERLTLDYVEDKERQEEVPAGGMDRIAGVLGKLLDRARDGSFPSLPHPRGCPFLAEFGAYCDFGEVCRLRAGYSPEVPAGEEADP